MHTKSVVTHDGILRATILAYINTIRTYKMIDNHTQRGPHSEHTKNTLPQKNKLHFSLQAHKYTIIQCYDIVKC